MTKMILLVEDNQTDEKLTIRAFRKCGVANEVAVARDGAEALDYLFATGRHAARAGSDLPSVVLLDLKLPRIDGLEVLRRLRADAATADIACISLSANAMPDDIERALQAGFADYWTKPLDLQRFVHSLQAFLGTPH